MLDCQVLENGPHERSGNAKPVDKGNSIGKKTPRNRHSRGAAMREKSGSGFMDTAILHDKKGGTSQLQRQHQAQAVDIPRRMTTMARRIATVARKRAAKKPSNRASAVR